MVDYSALYEDAPDDVVFATYQELINNGDAWRLEGHVGRTAMRLIEDGLCILGETDHRDYYGNHVPSRTQVEPGTKGSLEYAKARHPERWSDAKV